ncbi:MAG: class I adenylate-forming enzyme family protein [Pseudomonadota bacterium]
MVGGTALMTKGSDRSAADDPALSQSAPQFAGAPPPAAFNLTHYAIGRTAAAAPDRIALEVAATPDGDIAERLTFRELERSALKIGAALLSLGLEPGDRLLIKLPNTSTYALTFFGAIAVGLIPIPASDQLTASEVTFLLDDSGARAIVGAATEAASVTTDHDILLVTADDLAAAAAKAAPASYAATTANTPAYLIYTSGTTSKPKGVLHAHRAAWGRRPMYHGWYGLEPDDRVLHAGAFNWTYTLGTGLTDPWANGATALVYTGPKEPDVWPRLLNRLSATLFAAVPGLYRQMIKYAPNAVADLETLRHGLMAGEAPPPDLIPSWSQLTGRPIYEALGMSEISTYISTGPETASRTACAGRPQPGRSVAILSADAKSDTPLQRGEEGLLAVHRSDPGLMLGYWQRPDEEAQVFRGDWFVGGDLARMDHDGYVTHCGRANDVIKALGYRISPLEVEAALLGHPAIAEVACAELHVGDGVTILSAFYVCRPDAAQPTPSELDRFAETCLATYKRPRHWQAIDMLPRTANGKLQRARLKLVAAPGLQG